MGLLSTAAMKFARVSISRSGSSSPEKDVDGSDCVRTWVFTERVNEIYLRMYQLEKIYTGAEI